MAKFKVEVPPDVEEVSPDIPPDVEEVPPDTNERPGFSFRGSNPVPVGEEPTPEGEISVQRAALDISLGALAIMHRALVQADGEAFGVAEGLLALRNGVLTPEGRQELLSKIPETIATIRRDLIWLLVALDHPLFVTKTFDSTLSKKDYLEHLDRMRARFEAEFDRWGVLQPNSELLDTFRVLTDLVAELIPEDDEGAQ